MARAKLIALGLLPTTPAEREPSSEKRVPDFNAWLTERFPVPQPPKYVLIEKLPPEKRERLRGYMREYRVKNQGRIAARRDALRLRRRTAKETALWARVEGYINEIPWSAETPSDYRLMVAENVRAFYAWLRKRHALK